MIPQNCRTLVTLSSPHLQVQVQQHPDGDDGSPLPRSTHRNLQTHGITLVTNVPQFANTVRGELGIYSVASQMLPLSSATPAP
jgi:hypothetical protein